MAIRTAAAHQLRWRWLVAILAAGLVCASGEHPTAGARPAFPEDGAAAAPVIPEITATVTTTGVAHDVDDPAIWVHPSDGARSLILGTVKVAAPGGALVVYDLEGRIVQTVEGLDRPNNVDVEYGFDLAGRKIDLVVVTERLQRRLLLFRVADEGRQLVELGSAPVLAGQPGESGAPMGIALYRRPSDGRVYAIVAPKSGPRDGYLWQYLLHDNGTGGVRATPVRRFGTFSGVDEIEAVAVDDALGYVYFADESSGIRKWHADPDHPEAARELAHFGRDGFRGDREGIAVYALDDGTGYIVCADQRPDRSEYRIYRREGEPGRPHDHARAVKVVRGNADSTDGVEVTSRSLGTTFPHGALVAMNSDGRNFLVFPWDQLAAAGRPALLVAGLEGRGPGVP